MNEGICTTEEACEEIRNLQLYNLTNDSDREVILATAENFQEGYGHNIKPTRVLLAVIETHDDQRIKGIIVNDMVAVSNAADADDHPYSEIELDKISRN